jgi:hypothetical protein
MVELAEVLEHSHRQPERTALDVRGSASAPRRTDVDGVDRLSEKQQRVAADLGLAVGCQG